MENACCLIKKQTCKIGISNIQSVLALISSGGGGVTTCSRITSVDMGWSGGLCVHTSTMMHLNCTAIRDVGQINLIIGPIAR